MFWEVIILETLGFFKGSKHQLGKSDEPIKESGFRGSPWPCTMVTKEKSPRTQASSIYTKT